jgi:hypothetical protein
METFFERLFLIYPENNIYVSPRRRSPSQSESKRPATTNGARHRNQARRERRWKSMMETIYSEKCEGGKVIDDTSGSDKDESRVSSEGSSSSVWNREVIKLHRELCDQSITDICEQLTRALVFEEPELEGSLGQDDSHGALSSTGARDFQGLVEDAPASEISIPGRRPKGTGSLLALDGVSLPRLFDYTI